MARVNGYSRLQLLYTGKYTALYRAGKEDGGQAVLLKLPLAADDAETGDDPTLAELASLQIAADGDAVVFRKVAADAGPLLEADAADLVTLRELTDEGAVSVELFCAIAGQLLDLTDRLHRSGFVHCNLNPASIVVDRAGRRCRWVDMSFAAAMTHVGAAVIGEQSISSILPYMSPEQTGLVDRPVDYRTDIYALGVVLYEWLAGHHPFAAHKPAEWVYGHLAQQVVHPKRWREDVPEALCRVILKCLSKQADDRYPSVARLKKDWLAGQESGSGIQPSPDAVDAVDPGDPGEGDPPATFSIPQKLYEREETLAAMLAAMADDAISALFVSGRAGVGKSSIVGEVRRQLSDRSHMLYGKCDAFKPTVPYQPFREMLRQFIAHILGQSPPEVEQWRARIADALGGNASVMVRFIPQLSHIIGCPPPAEALPFVEEQQRFHTALLQFIETLLHERRQVVIIIDDLQWSSFETLTMLESILLQGGPNRLRVIGIYREEQASSVKALKGFIHGLRRSRIAMREWELRPLSSAAVNQWVAEALQCAPERSRELGDYIYRLTYGNPQFIREMLTLLHNDGWLYFDYGAWGWKWDLPSIKKLQLSDDIFQLLMQKLLQLSPDCKRMLKIAACFGNAIPLRWLEQLYEGLHGASMRSLPEAAESGLIMLQDDHCQFVHDRMHQLVYEWIPEQELRHIHGRIGQFLDRLPPAEGEDRFFHKVHAMNLGHDPLGAQEEPIRLAELNLEAGRKAKSSTANQAALTFFTYGIRWLPADAWDSHYALMFQLWLERMECEYLCGDFAAADRSFDTMMDVVSHRADRARIYLLKVMIYRRLDRHPEAIAVGLDGLGLFGLQFSPYPSRLKVMREYVRMKRRTRRMGMDKLARLPSAHDDEVQIMMDLMAAMSPSAYLKYPLLIALLSMKIMELTFAHGTMNSSALGYAAYGVVCIEMGDFHTGVKMGRLGIETADRCGSLMDRHGTRFVYGCLLGHWQIHAREAETAILEGAGMSMAHGDWSYAGYSIPHHLSSLMFRGEPLSDIYGRLDEYARQTRGFKEIHFVLGMKIIRRFIRAVIGSERDRDDDDDSLLESIDMTMMSERKSFDYDFYEMWGAYLNGDYALALSYAAKAERNSGHCMGVILIPDVHLFIALCSLAGAKPGSLRYGRVWRQVNRRFGRVKRWARACPANFLHKEMLIRAEMERVWGKRGAAARYYEAAAQSAAEHGFIHMEAVIYERMSQFYVEGRERIAAEACLHKAYRLFHRWGALRKCEALERRFAWFADTAGRRKGGSEHSLSEYVNSAAIVSTAQALSTEIELDELLKKLMTIVIQTVGAEKGKLFIAAQQEFLLEASGEMAGGAVATEVLMSEPLETVEGVARSVIHYSTNTRETVVLADAAEDGRYAGDPYIDRHRIKSLYCQPLIQQNRLFGILYLENNLTSGVFTAEHVKVLTVILSHIAITIENAGLYASVKKLNLDLEAKVKQRTESLRQSMNNTRAVLAEKAVLEERSRIVGEIHDTIGHTLTTVHIQLEAGKRLIDKDKQLAMSKFEQSQAQVRKGLQDIKKALGMLKEGVSTDEQLPSLELFIQETMLQTGVNIEYELCELPELSAQQHKVLYRALQEGITNGIRHGESKSFRFTLERIDGQAHFTLIDFGKGSEHIRFGLGLSSMRRRVEESSGTLVIESAADRGCKLHIRLPFQA